MARRLPPLNAVRAFEAAARHLSFTKAAGELYVTQAAVSHQVKALEESLGLALFRRYNRRLVLTEAGQAYLPPLREALDLIAAASERLRQAEATGGLKVSVLPSFAAKWLLPRLSRFRAQYPEIDVLISATDDLADFGSDQVDVAIRYGFGGYPGLDVDYLMGDDVYPVCSPQLLETGPPLRKPEDLHAHTLLHDTTASVDGTMTWARWLNLVGVPGIDPSRGPGFTDSSLMMQAAIDGLGVALGRRALTSTDLEAGRLVIPFGPSLRSNLKYFVVAPAGSSQRGKVCAFRDWLLEETAAERAKEGEQD